MTLGRIDTHNHIIPEAYAQWLRDDPRYHDALPGWTLEGARRLMERTGVETSVLSVTVPGTWLGPDSDVAEARYWARSVNEYCADLVRDDPRSFGYFATLTLPDIDGSIAEAEHALGELGADGITLLTNTDGTYLGDPSFDPVFEALSELGAVVFVHPRMLPSGPLPGIMPGVVDFLADTSRAAVNLTVHNVLDRFPGITFILSHGGGYVPYAAMRIASMITRGEYDSEEERIEAGIARLRRFYFDLALTGGPAMSTLLDFADPTHLLFGTDHPFAPTTMSAAFADRLDRTEMDAGLRAAIGRGNAERLFPRLARS